MGTEAPAPTGQEPTVAPGQEPNQPPEGTPPQAPAPTGQEPTGPPAQGEPQPDQLPEWARKQIADLRTEAAKHRTRAKELEDAQLSEKERTEKDRDEWRTKAEAAQAKWQTALKQSALVAEASKQGAVDPGLVAQLLADKVDVNDDGEPVAVADAVKTLLADKPFLTGGAPVPKLGASQPGNTPAQAGQLTRDDLQTMTPDQIVKAKADGRLDALLRGDT